jgi:hypothetical protein
MVKSSTTADEVPLFVTLADEPAAPVVTVPIASVVAGPVSPCGPRSPTLVTATFAVPPFVIVGAGVPVDPGTVTLVVLPPETVTVTSLPAICYLTGSMQ